MNQFFKTERCVACNRKAICWTGHVVAYSKMAFGNQVPVKIAAGRCKKHMDLEIVGLPFKKEYGISDVDLFDRPIVKEELFYK